MKQQLLCSGRTAREAPSSSHRGCDSVSKRERERGGGGGGETNMEVETAVATPGGNSLNQLTTVCSGVYSRVVSVVQYSLSKWVWVSSNL